MENIGLASRIIHTVATNTFFGGAFYVNIVETPARKSLKTASAVMDHFQASFPRAAFLMKRLAMVSSISGFIGWYTDKTAESNFLLASWILTTLMIPFTIIGISPLNNELMDGDTPKKKGDAWVQSMMTRWDRLHGARTVASGVAVLCLTSYWIKLSL